MKHGVGMEREQRCVCLSTQIFAKELLKRNVRGLTVKKNSTSCLWAIEISLNYHVLGFK